MESQQPSQVRLRSSWLILVFVALNFLVFIMWNAPGSVSPEFMARNFLVSATGLEEGRYWTLLTSVFSHNLLWHFLINMFVLWNFGPLLERVLGRMNFFLFYIGAGIVSSLGHVLVSAMLLHDPDLPALGASGALSAMIIVFALIFPREKILLLGFIPVRALIGALAFVCLDLYGLFSQARGGGLPIGHGAHLGGALAGALYFLFIVRPRLKRQVL